MGSTRRDYALILLASVLWGTSFPGSKLTVGTVDPLFLTFARMGLGAALGVTVLVILHRLDPKMFHEPIVWILGAINAIGFDLQNEGIFRQSASRTALLVNVNIVFIVIFMALFFREAITRAKVAGILIGGLGVLVLATKLDPTTLSGGQFAGDVLVFLAGLTWAFYVAGSKSRVYRAEPPRGLRREPGRAVHSGARGGWPRPRLSGHRAPGAGRPHTSVSSYVSETFTTAGPVPTLTFTTTATSLGLAFTSRWTRPAGMWKKSPGASSTASFPSRP